MVMQFTKMATNERNTQSLLYRISPRVQYMFVKYDKDINIFVKKDFSG